MTDPKTELKPILSIVATGAALSEDEAEKAFEIIMSGGATPAQLGAFLMALRVRGETVDEITGAVKIMRAKMLPIKAPPGAIDIVGTGGDASGTYNISTGAAIVTAACGVPVAKHGNRALSSKCGTADVLTTLGVKIDADLELVTRSIWETNLGFLMATSHHRAMRHVGPTRVELGIRSIFNILGPLSNPAGVKRQLSGAFSRQWIEPMARTLGNLGSEMVWIVHGSDGLDELTTTGASFVAQLKDGAVTTFDVTPDDAGLPHAASEDLKGGNPEHNAEAMRTMLGGAHGPLRDVVLLNAAAALLVAGKVETLKAGAERAARAIDDGHAMDTLDDLIAVTNAPTEAALEEEVGG
ncbi:anthranilate phosphoribosyltransferase [Varunaivibrio sulfuroxidans]|uniref:Anthranilate phosphoribosyltransferase n=1 Tax=Varunaivibrio sulfuroxidans TaxID=1773489 RepID=A0A4R3JFW5_9PROT|nr:anthranilate phosphoribosyltransferase [Varunaivibrio sulfuroxidans]TCS64183.1 anthranilate phosphoribosyltransferase [Varunaivibrio sulfuroxidans]WES31372.1 anthranilate phosphoribosyltransferase [Varunaivibrio sulfuroxidans]